MKHQVDTKNSETPRANHETHTRPRRNIFIRSLRLRSNCCSFGSGSCFFPLLHFRETTICTRMQPLSTASSVAPPCAAMYVLVRRCLWCLAPVCATLSWQPCCVLPHALTLSASTYTPFRYSVGKGFPWESILIGDAL